MNYYFKVLQNYAVFTGRARRSEYWYFALFNIIISFALAFIGGLTGLNFLAIIYVLAVLIPGIAVAIRRMHDVGKSGWFILIPVYNLILALTESEKGENEYGPNPKATEYDDTDISSSSLNANTASKDIYLLLSYISLGFIISLIYAGIYEIAPKLATTSIDSVYKITNWITAIIEILFLVVLGIILKNKLARILVIVFALIRLGLFLLYVVFK